MCYFNVNYNLLVLLDFSSRSFASSERFLISFSSASCCFNLSCCFIFSSSAFILCCSAFILSFLPEPFGCFHCKNYNDDAENDIDTADDSKGRLRSRRLLFLVAFSNPCAVRRGQRRRMNRLRLCIQLQSCKHDL